MIHGSVDPGIGFEDAQLAGRNRCLSHNRLMVPRYWGVSVLAAKLFPTELTTGDPTHRLGPKRLRRGLPCHNPRIATKQKLCCTWKSAGRTIQVAQARDPKLMHQHLASEVRQMNVCDDVNRKIKWSKWFQCLPIHQITASMSWMQRAGTR